MGGLGAHCHPQNVLWVVQGGIGTRRTIYG